MKTVYLLWKLWRLMERSKSSLAATSINIIVERTEASSYVALCEAAAFAGLPPPRQRTGWEVSLWLDANEAQMGTKTKRGATLAEALGAALART